VAFPGLTARSLSLFTAVGGWRTIAETVASRAVFLIAYLLTGELRTSVLVAVGAVALLALVRVCTDRKYWPALFGLAAVGTSALVAGSTGNPADFYLTAVLSQTVEGTAHLVSILARWPLVGVVVESVSGKPGERRSWRRDRARRRRYERCSAVFVAKCSLAVAVLVPLYLAERLLPLGIAAILLGGAPGGGVCTYLCWRILRDQLRNSAPPPSAESPGRAG
jgi:hypothetical protein